jgi:hypothetical protein
MSGWGQAEANRPIQQNDSFNFETGYPSALERTSASVLQPDVDSAVRTARGGRTIEPIAKTCRMNQSVAR